MNLKVVRETKKKKIGGFYISEWGLIFLIFYQFHLILVDF